MKHSKKIIEAVLEEFYRKKHPKEAVKDNRSHVIGKALGLHYQTVNLVLKNHFKDMENNPPEVLGFERECDCYRHKKMCKCEIKC